MTTTIDNTSWQTLRSDIMKQLARANYRQQAMIKHYTNFVGARINGKVDREEIAQAICLDIIDCPEVQEYQSVRHWMKWPDTTKYYKAVYAATKYHLKKVYNQSVYADEAVNGQFKTVHAEDYQETMMNLKTTKSMTEALQGLVSGATEEQATIIFWRLGLLSETDACEKLQCSRRSLFNKFNSFKAGAA
jgi:hypothetical protein